ncbi:MULTISPECIES: ISAs1 family transposase [Cyanophyceae]|uniref:ISAs1 family transposase n=1 Tax=Cyanophyceae TaxID=3028117 RepID=UPI001F558074|nr:ISAs1 family transposase [Trichocoleus sp. FACHB-40]
MAKGLVPAVAPQIVVPKILEAAAVSQRLQDCFASITDPRVERTRLHQLSDILTIAILSVIAGGQGWEDMELYGVSKQGWLSTFLALPNGIPSEETFRRVFEQINPKQLEQCFEQWVKQLVDELGIQVIAIDGKGVNGSYNRQAGSKALHLVSAWATQHRLVLAQTKVQDKSNEITAIPALLELLDIQGCIVTLDAMGTQKDIAYQIHTAHADYILSLKANHPTLFQQVDRWLNKSRAEGTLPAPSEHTTEAGHHRTESRKVWTLSIDLFPALYQADEWAGLQRIVVVERTRHLWNKTTHEIQFYLSSLPPQSSRIAAAIRQHWGIENSLHWTLDVTFAEDGCRVRSLPAPHNLALLRRFAVNALNREATGKRSLRQKSKQAAMDDTYMLTVLAAALPDPIENLDPICK